MKFDPFNNLPFKQIYDDAYDLEIMLRQQAEDEGEDDLERRYKIIVLSLLPVICDRVRAIFFAFALVLGFTLAVVVKLALKF